MSTTNLLCCVYVVPNSLECFHAVFLFDNLENGDMAASALAEHALTAGHGVDLSKAEVLDSNPYTATRCMLESWHIQRNENKLNRERGNLPEVYTALLD